VDPDTGDDVANLLDELLVVRQLEGLHPMRPEFMRLPDALDAGVAETAGSGHLAAGPMGSSGGLLVQGVVHDLLDRLAGQRRLTSRSRAVAPQPGNALGQRLTVTLLMLAERATAITPSRSANNNTIRDRQTTFCRVFRPETNPSNVARSAADSLMHACVFCFPADSHTRPNLGIVCWHPSTSSGVGKLAENMPIFTATSYSYE
jgi:hypothetical protein